MPKFIDYHEQMPNLPREAAEQMASAIRAGQSDEFGVKPVNVYIGDGRGWCLSEAPNADAIVKTHQARGFALDRHNVTEVTSLA